MFKHADYVMVTVSDMTRSVAFYKDVLGLPLKHESKEWTEFDTGPTKLALHGGGKPKGSTLDEPGKTYAGDCSIGFSVSDLDRLYRELRAKGARFVMPPTKREGEGIKLAVCLDPDGLPISFAEEGRQTHQPVKQAQAES